VPDDAIERLLRRRKRVSSADVATALGVTRQAAHRRLRKLAAEGKVVAVGAGRTARWEVAGARRTFRFHTTGLAEDRAWEELRRTVPELAALPESATRIASYAFTEMLNNAIDHSGSKTVDVTIEPVPGGVSFEIVDRGLGAFETVRDRFHLASPLDALGEISKGKATTKPEAHAGEGLFFTSKAVRRFVLEANGQAWLVDDERGDEAAAPSDVRRGTRVRFEVPSAPKRTLVQLFEAYTEDHAFAKTRIVVRLFERGADFVSRSEARRLLAGLERFREVVLDFARVKSVGQGFCDEVFRVWAEAHPEVRLVVEHAAEEVAFMIRRVRH
jgi:DNA-binding Lrp family transcriptional regulator